ncbi:hypothetical protein [Flavilitoribacter nigricans]|nr:hypothetical protein [Flavilitoribacter nigricans]
MKIYAMGLQITFRLPVGRKRRPIGFYQKPAPWVLRWPIVIRRTR